MGETVTMWSIMDASTKGKVTELTGKLLPGRYGGIRYFQPNRWSSLTVGKEVFEHEDEATAAAKVKVAKRIASLEKTLAKARKNPFAPTPSAASL